MIRLRWAGALLVGFAWASFGCATYNQDLDRARRHYDQNRFENALALFRVLEADMDSFSRPEQAQYAYLRGMTDYRLSGLAAPGNDANDPKREFRSHARHWLAVAAAIEKQVPGGITPDEKQRLGDTLTELNKDVYGPSLAAARQGQHETPKPAAPASTSH